MHSKVFLALAAIGAGVVSAADCDKSITVKSVGDANIACKTVKGDITFDPDEDISGAVDISGPEEITGNLIIKENKKILTLTSSSIQKIGGKFQLQEMESLTGINFSELEEVGEIEWITLTALESVTFGTEGVTTIKKVRLSDTSLTSLEGFNPASVGTFSIDNNQGLTKWETKLTEITEKLIIADNSADLEVSFPKLTGAGDIDVRGVKGLDMPLLEKISGSFLLTDNNVMESFIAPNLTKTQESVSLRNNDGLSNVSFPVLTRTGGALTLHNNQKLLKIDGFPKLEKVDGSVTMRGNFTDIELPSLQAVQGTLDVQSTENIDDACEAFEELKDSVDGKFQCKSENENANAGSGKDGDDNDDAGVFLGANAPLVLSVAVVGGLLQLL